MRIEDRNLGRYRRLARLNFAVVAAEDRKLSDCLEVIVNAIYSSDMGVAIK